MPGSYPAKQLALHSCTSATIGRVVSHQHVTPCDLNCAVTASCGLGCVEQDRQASCIAAIEQEMQGLQEERAKVAKLRAQLEQAATRMQQEQRAWAKRKV